MTVISTKVPLIMTYDDEGSSGSAPAERRRDPVQPNAASGPGLDQLIQAVGVPVALFDEHLRCRTANAAFAQMCDSRMEDTQARVAHLLFPKCVALEQAANLERALRTGRPTRVVGMIGGRLTLSAYRPLSAADANSPVVMVVCSPVTSAEQLADQPGQPPVLKAGSHDWGRLTELSIRELQVLALLGRGASTQELARALFRSEKTIEHHRSVLGRKLRAPNRASLARCAIDAGIHVLTPEELEAMWEISDLRPGTRDV